jgi:diguanylate cyclase (GGDEF)-like protein
MRKFNSGHRTRVSVVLALTVLVVAATVYGLGATESWRGTLAVAVAAGALLALSWMLVGVLRQKEERLHHRTHYDPLTNLPNRSKFVDRVHDALDRAARRSRSIAVLVVDLDDFEEINHSLGHEAGDQLLAAAGERIEASVRPGGAVARLCSDEFAVLLEDVTDQRSAVYAAKRIGEEVRTPTEVDGSEVLVSASIGVAIGGSSQEAGPEDLLRNADVAMHAAKRKGKARYRVFDPGADTTTSGRSLVEADMRRAIEEGEFRVHYQPLVELRSGRVCGFEALLRWQHPIYGLILPGEFVPLAEQTGLIVPIGRWVLQEACRQVRLWQNEHPGPPPLTLNVNVSARQFGQPNLTEEFLSILEKSELDPHHLQLEITESVMVYDVSASVALGELKSAGVKLAMDDFGTGYSNLSYVKRLPVDTLKIDRSYVRGLGRNAEDTAIVHATVAFAKALGLSLAAEGIENTGQLARLRDLGCELGQGYNFAKPLPSQEVPAFLSAHLHDSTTTGSR